MRPSLLVLALLALVSPTLAQDPVPPTPPVPVEETDNDRGVKAYEARDFPVAIVWFEKALEAAPTSQPIKANLARALHANSRTQVRDGELIDATRALERAIALDGSEPRFAVELAQVWQRRADLGAARATLVVARNTHPDDPGVHEAFARLEYAEERLGEALDLVERAIALSAKPTPRRLVRLRDKIAREREVEGNWFTDVRGQFTVKYDDQDFRAVGTAILDELDKAYRDIARHLDHFPKQRLNVVLYARRDYDVATGARSWTGGLFDGKIRIPVRNYARAREQIRLTIRHELTHWFVRDLAPSCPIWLHEGLAQLMEGKTFGAREKGRLAILGANPSVLDLPVSWVSENDARKVRAYYALTLGFTAWLDRRHGGPFVRDLLTALGKRKKLDAAFLELTGTTFEEAESAFRASL